MPIVLFPDFKGENFLEFSNRILDVDSDLITIAGLNGGGIGELFEKTKIESKSINLITESGFNNAVFTLFKESIKIKDDKIARLDTREHDIEILPEGFTDLDNYSLIVMDLTFPEGTLRKGSPDEELNLRIMPSIISDATDGEIKLSGAHGYMFFRRGVLKEIVEVLNVIYPTIKDKVNWGLDSAAVLIAYRLGYKVKVNKVPASELRDRDIVKIEKQVSDTKIWVEAINNHFLENLKN